MTLKSIALSELSDDLQDELALLLSHGFPSDSSDLWKKRFAYWWHANPYLSTDSLVGWYVFDEESSSIVGFLGKITAPYQ